MHLLTIKRDGLNPLNGKAKYRVIHCLKTREGCGVFNEHEMAYSEKSKKLFIATQTAIKVGTIINPRKSLFG